MTTSSELAIPEVSQASIQDVLDVVQDDYDATNELIAKSLESNVDTVSAIGRYIVTSGGKRLRPLLAILVSRALGFEGNEVNKLAVLIEFLHTATLLHDDVVDHSEQRRGRKTANLLWGNAESILVGDFLYSRGFQLMVELNNMAIMGVIADATNQIAEGEVKQLEHVGDANMSESDYMEVIRGKSAMLFQASSETGATIANASPTDIESARLFGLHFGLAYQLIDDMLDYGGSTETLGKKVGIDLAEGKPTLPLIFAIQHCEKEKSDRVKQAIVDKNPEVSNDVFEIVKSSGALAYTRTNAMAQTYLAKSALYRLPPNRYRQALFQLADIALTREH